MPLPLTSTDDRSMDPHSGHIGDGGWHSRSHDGQRWMRSCPLDAPSQKKASSGSGLGAMTVVNDESDTIEIPLLVVIRPPNHTNYYY